MMKCTKCGEFKPDDCFYNKKVNGLIKKRKQCKECISRNRILNELGLVKNATSEKRAAYDVAYRKRHPERKIARRIIAKLLKDGSIKRGACVVCSEENAESHHPDYSKPEKIVWLCRKHHMEAHRKYIIPKFSELVK